MAYASGTATDEQDLVGQLDTFLTSTIGGWTKIGTITDTATDKDYVYKSTGENPGLYRDLYIRIRGYSNNAYIYGYSYWESVGTNDGELYDSNYSRIATGTSSMSYWFFGDKDHFWAVVKTGTSYYSGGAGYLYSYYTPEENDLPLVVIGHASVSYALTSSSRSIGYSATSSGTKVIIRAPTDIHGAVLAYGDPNTRDGSQAHVPFVMYCTTAGHQEIQGELRGALFFSGDTVSSEEWITVSGTDSKFFIAKYSTTACIGFGPVPV